MLNAYDKMEISTEASYKKVNYLSTHDSNPRIILYLSRPINSE